MKSDKKTRHVTGIHINQKTISSVDISIYSFFIFFTLEKENIVCFGFEISLSIKVSGESDEFVRIDWKSF